MGSLISVSFVVVVVAVVVRFEINKMFAHFNEIKFRKYESRLGNAGNPCSQVNPFSRVHCPLNIDIVIYCKNAANYYCMLYSQWCYFSRQYPFYRFNLRPYRYKMWKNRNSILFFDSMNIIKSNNTFFLLKQQLFFLYFQHLQFYLH